MKNPTTVSNTTATTPKPTFWATFRPVVGVSSPSTGWGIGCATAVSRRGGGALACTGADSMEPDTLNSVLQAGQRPTWPAVPSGNPSCLRHPGHVRRILMAGIPPGSDGSQTYHPP